MRIDLNYGPQATQESSESRAQNSRAADSISTAGTGTAEDQAQLSGAHTQVEALAAQASQLPEVREQKVQGLRLAVVGGQYQPDPETIAGALMTHMMTPTAAHV